MAVVVVMMLCAIVSCSLMAFVNSVAIELPSVIASIPKFNVPMAGPYRCIGIVSFSLNSTAGIFKFDNINVERENGFITLMSGSGSSNMELCNGPPIAARCDVYVYVEGIGWQFFHKYSREDVCPPGKIGPKALAKAREYSTGETEPGNPPWQPGNYAWANIPGCIKIKNVPVLPYRRFKGNGELILNKTIIGTGEAEVIVGPATGTDKYGVILM